MSDSGTRIVLTGRISFEQEITLAQAGQIIQFLAGESGAFLASSGFSNTPKDGGTGDRSIGSAREAIQASGANKNPEKIAALGAYLTKSGNEHFSNSDLRREFVRARESLPGNLNRDISTAIRSGWLAENDNKELYLTIDPEEVLSGSYTFATKSVRSSARTSTKKIRRGTRAKPEALNAIDEVPNAIEGIPSYTAMKTGRDRLIWSLYFARKNDLRGLANKDVAWITDHLGVAIESKQVTAAFNLARKAGLANKSTQDGTMRITEQGMAYLEGLKSV